MNRAKTIKELYGEKIAVLGLGREGHSMLSFLITAPHFQNAEIWVLDKNTETKVPEGVHKKLGSDYLSNLDEFDLIFRTPGIPYMTPEIQKALKSEIVISSATKLFFEEVRKLPSKPLILGITGTKGKGTTSTLLYNILRAAKKNVFLGGNIGTSALELLPELARMGPRAKPIVILELSSFQLQDLAVSPDIAVILEMFPDHQDSHKTLEEYYAAKSNIARYQKKSDRVFFFANNKMSAVAATPGHGQKISVDETMFRHFSEHDMAIPGWHNFKNAVMTATVAHTLGIPERTIKKTVKAFRGTEHRLEFVRNIEGIDIYNDSASTNPQTTMAAVLAFPRIPKVLIMGGQDKNLDYTPFAKILKGAGVNEIVLCGENSAKIEAAIAKSGVPIVHAKNIAGAITVAYAAIKAIKAPQRALIFSPGATSFDMFKDYKERGEQFKDLVRSLT